MGAGSDLAARQGPDSGGGCAYFFNCGSCLLLRRDDRADEAYRLLGNRAPSFWSVIRNIAKDLSGPESKELKALADGAEARVGIKAKPSKRHARGVSGGQTTL